MRYLVTTKFRDFSFAIAICVSISMKNTESNSLAMERYSKLTTEPYREPVEGKFDNITRVLWSLGSGTEISDGSDMEAKESYHDPVVTDAKVFSDAATANDSIPPALTSDCSPISESD